MDNFDIDALIIERFNAVKNYDNDLLSDVNERTFVFRYGHYLANYLENESSYKVDIEYNRYNNDIKKLNNKNIYPDLIVHKRRKNDNLLAIEFKKNNDSQKDKQRLIQLKKNKEYLCSNVYFIVINKNKIEKYENCIWININGDIYE